MKERLYRILNIKFSESSQVFDLLYVQFFLGLANAFLNIVSFTLFVYNFPIHTLPVVYLCTAVLLFLCNIAYEKIEHKLAPPQLLKFIVGVSALLLMVLWMGLTFGNGPVAIVLDFGTIGAAMRRQRRRPTIALFLVGVTHVRG